MGLFGSICSFVGSVVSGAMSIVGSAISSIGSALASATNALLSIAGNLISAVVKVVETIGIVLGIITPEDDIEELGAKAMEADKKPEDFDTNAEYIDYLKNEVKLDQEKFKNATEKERVARRAIGATIVIKGVEEKKGFDIPMEMWVALARLDLQDKGKEIDKILDTFGDGKLDDFVKYTEGKLDAKRELEVGDTLVDMYKVLEPNTSEEDIEKKVMKMDIGGK